MKWLFPVFPIYLPLFLNICLLGAQSLPEEMRFSDDGRRLITGGNPTEGFYDESIVRTIDLHFDQPNYWNLLSDNYQSGTDLPATMTVDGVTYDNVGVHFKGQTSYFLNNSQKKSFNITLDYLHENQDIMGYETLNLNCGFEDPSSIREVLYNHIGRNYCPSLKSNFVVLTLNGQNWGPYANVQQINGDYLEEWFLSNDGTRWRALKTGGGPGGFGTGFSTLNYLGPDTSAYKPYYTLKKANKPNPWQDLVTVCTKLNNLPLAQLEDSLKYFLDVDKALWFLAHEIVFTDEDGYVSKGGMDYYVYWEPETDRIIPLEYDGNSTIRPNDISWSPCFKQSDTKFPLMNRLFAVPGLRQRYLAHVRTILQQYMAPAVVNAQIDHYVDQIGTLVQNDPKKIYSYTHFLNEINGVKNIIADRRNFLLNHPEINVTGLTVSEVNYASEGVAGQNPDAGEEVVVTAKVSGAAGVSKVMLHYGTGFVGVFQRTQMLDDGQHGDGQSGDGVFGATVPGFDAGAYVRYYIEAIADNTPKTATFEPAGAEHDVYIYRVNVAPTVLSDVVINELMADNDNTAADQNGEYDDWIELYNKSAQTIDLSLYYLSDNPDNLLKWQFPGGTNIEPDGYLIIWADEDGAQAGLHANFKLSADGEELFLMDPDGNVADHVTFPDQPLDKGYARRPNGTGSFIIQAPTFSANNDTVNSVSGLETGKAITVFPNPAGDEINIRLPEGAPVLLQIADLWGRVVMSEMLYNSESTVSIDRLEAGMYFLRIEGMQPVRLVIQR